MLTKSLLLATHPGTPSPDNRSSGCGSALTEHETLSPLVKDVAFGEDKVELVHDDHSYPLGSRTVENLAQQRILHALRPTLEGSRGLGRH